MPAIALENSLLKATFDKNTGALQTLLHKPTKWRIQRRAKLGLLFRMLAPIPNRRNNPILGEKQAPPRIEHDAANNRLTLHWDKLISQHGGELDIAFTATIALTDAGLAFDGQIANRSPHVLEAIQYPLIGDLARPSKSAKVEQLTLSYWGMTRTPIFPTFANNKGYFGTDFPIHLTGGPAIPFVLLDTGTHGLYIGHHDTTAKNMVQFIGELKPGYEHVDTFQVGTVPATDEISGEPNHVEYSTAHFPFVNPGETAQIGRIMVSPYVGSWHKGADDYRAWRDTWFKPARVPDWAKGVHSWQQIHINSPEDELRCRYTELLKYGQDCAKHGVAAIQLVGWNLEGQDRGNPSHDTEPRLGTPEELKAAIADIHKLGVKMILFTKFIWADRSHPWFRKELIKWAAKDPYGDYYVYSGYQYQTPTQLADINTRRLIPMCMAAEGYRQIAAREFQKVLDLGAAGMVFDECAHHSPAFYCFDPSHAHHVPAHVYEGDMKLLQQFHQLTDQQSPDFLYAGESCYELEQPYYNVVYYRIDKDHVPMHRYIDPQIGIMMAIYGHDEREAINQCLLYRYIISYEPRNFKGRLEEFPLSLEYGKKVDGLRKRYAEFLWDGTFRHTLGAKVHTKGKNQPTYSVFTAASGKRAVVLANFDPKKTLALRLELDPPATSLLLATPESPDAIATDGAITLPPRSAAVLMEV